jgi:hypothetical protein
MIVDHTGLDILAFNPSTEKRLGITVKSRTRFPRLEEDSVNIFSYQKGKDDRQNYWMHARHLPVSHGSPFMSKPQNLLMFILQV